MSKELGKGVFSNREPLKTGIENEIEWSIYLHEGTGAINGYARIPENHPWRELDDWQWQCSAGVEVHGGITYGISSNGWIGFDTSHAWDYWENAQFSSFMGDEESKIVWTKDLVIEETKSLARQIAGRNQVAR